MQIKNLIPRKRSIKKKEKLEDANKKLNAGRPSTTQRKNLLPAQPNLKPKFVQNVKIEFHYNYIEDQRYADGLKRYTSCEDKEKILKNLIDLRKKEL